jgi:hypothetical protein
LVAIRFQSRAWLSVTTVILVSIAFCAIAASFLIVRRAMARGDLNSMTVSNRWLTQHQSND